MDDRGERCGRRFAILRHEMPPEAARPSHWDLMLEYRGVLLAWELPAIPFAGLPATFEDLGIRRLGDHRMAYLTYEGPVSGDRGSVVQVDSGEYWLVSPASNEPLELRAIGRCYHFRLRLPQSCFSEGESEPPGVQVRSAESPKVPIFTGEVLEFSLVART